MNAGLINAALTSKVGQICRSLRRIIGRPRIGQCPELAYVPSILSIRGRSTSIQSISGNRSMGQVRAGQIPAVDQDGVTGRVAHHSTGVDGEVTLAKFNV